MKHSIELLRGAWTSSGYQGVGRAIFEAVPPDSRPDWAAALLLQAMGEKHPLPELQHVVDIGLCETRYQWYDAKEAFHEVRNLTLANERSPKPDKGLQLVLDVAETSAKVIFNASRASAPFDADAGWRMAPRIKKLAAQRNEPEFEDACWSLLTRTPRDKVVGSKG